MHLSDGVLTMPVVTVTTVVAGSLIAYSLKTLKQEDIPKISLMTATFFVLSLISIPIGPSSVHPLLCGLLGIMLGWQSPVAIFISLLLQALLFQHGGLTTLGANTLLVSVPAILCYYFFFHFNKNKKMSQTVISGLSGLIGVLLAVLILIATLFITSSYFSEGSLSVIKLLVIGHIPLLFIETLLTAFIINILVKVRPELILRKI
ncbi:cobalt transporter CbiM [Aliibacillus thermotolerans]|uniref:Cobalt transporter CbiM n=1 Tax=Aliibacillus thermotolerans TaxID=1834418 RepID=A0ABW0U8R9_9BACI|nr:cobalt transporter CbiM [Aliibacillus thermotolerans]MDA3130312.1 cobalt transporter CbiM [Aliibacillus thermotolerans]